MSELEPMGGPADPIAAATEVLPAALAEVAAVSLDMPLALEPARARFADAIGAVIGLVGPGWELELGLSGGHDEACAIASAFLGIPLDEVGPAEASEALTEVTNIAAGMVKRDLGGSDAGLALGLPAPSPGVPPAVAHGGVARFGAHALDYWIARR